MAGQQVIVCALGKRDYSKPTYVISDWLELVIPIALQQNISRYLMVSGAGLLKADDTTLIKDLPTYPQMFMNTNNDHARAFGMLQTSHLNWTLVCCPRIIEGQADGNYVIAKDYPPAGTLQNITAGNIGRFMAQEIKTEAYPRIKVGIAAKA